MQWAHENKIETRKNEPTQDCSWPALSNFCPKFPQYEDNACVHQQINESVCNFIHVKLDGSSVCSVGLQEYDYYTFGDSYARKNYWKVRGVSHPNAAAVAVDVTLIVYFILWSSINQAI